MAAITIKGREETLQITLSESDSFDCVITELRSKLITMQRLSQSTTWEAFFSIPSHYSEQELYRIFIEVADKQGIIAGFNQSSQQPVVSYAVHERDIRSGEHIDFTSTTIVFGDIHANAFVTCAGDLFVMGEIKGSVHLVTKPASLYAMRCFRANLQIFDEFRPDFTSFTPIHLYDEHKLKE